jgi:GWxTD domain-containing protein
MATIYNPSSTPLHPEMLICHEIPEISRLYVKLFTTELLFNQANREGKYMASLSLHYEMKEIINGNESEAVADSATIYYNLDRNEIKDIFIASIPLLAQQGKIYSLKVNTTDLLRKKSSLSFLDVDKSSINTAQNFRVISPSTGYPSFNRIFKKGDIFMISYAGKQIDTLFIKYYQNRFPLPRPPITNLSSPRPDFIPDSIYAFPYNDTIKFVLLREGMYYVQVDPREKGGLSLFNFGETYPRVTAMDDMIGPLAYLTSTIEFNDLINQTNKKLAVDNFWLQASGNVQTARELVRIYYNRVFYANYYFTSYKEGWKTDRGMMFIVYGPPNSLSKTADTEIWTYYRKRGKEPLRFTFSKVRDPYSDNDYQLERNFVNSMWMQAVQDWRRGKIFYADNI